MTVLYGLLGGATVGRTLAAYALIYAYCNLLLVLTLALMRPLKSVMIALQYKHRPDDFFERD